VSISEILVAIVTGAGDLACGADGAFTTPADTNEMWLTQKNQMLNRRLGVWKQAPVNGCSRVGGSALSLAMDIRIAAEHATSSLAEVKLEITAGTVAASGSSRKSLTGLAWRYC